jgi:quinol monooxygenase YgiN
MFGMIGKMRAAAGKRAELIALLSENAQTMPGCRHYIVMEDQSDPDGVWITEVWDSEASHKESLSLPAVQAAIARARPLIAGFSDRVVTTPVGGVGLTAARGE